MKKITIWLVSLFIGMVILASIIFSAEENGIKSYLNKIPKEEDIEQQFSIESLTLEINPIKRLNFVTSYAISYSQQEDTHTDTNIENYIFNSSMELVKLDNNPQSKYIRYFFDNISNATYTIKDERLELYIFDQIDDQKNIICGIKYFDEFTIIFVSRLDQDLTTVSSSQETKILQLAKDFFELFHWWRADKIFD